MSAQSPIRQVIHNMLKYGHLSFRDFVEVAMYHPQFGYYARSESPIGRGADYVTAPAISPAFSFAIGGLVREFLSRSGDAQSTIVDVGCGDGSLIRSLSESAGNSRAIFAGVDRSLDRVGDRGGVTFVTSLHEVPRGGFQLLIANELFDALPFARLVRRGDELHELGVAEHDGELDWSEHEASLEYEQYFSDRNIDLADGQFADVSLEWTAQCRDFCEFVSRGLILTFDYGHPAAKLFDRRARRFGTAAAYSRHRVTRDLLANPGEQDLTCHINFTDLIDTGEQNGFETLYFDRQARFLLSAGITEHPLFKPVFETAVASAEEGLALREQREDARRLVLPDGIGEDIRVLVQVRGMGGEQWSFERALY